MSRTIPSRLLAQSIPSVLLESASTSQILSIRLRRFSSTPRRKAEDESNPTEASNAFPLPVTTTTTPRSESSFPRQSRPAPAVSPSLHPKASTTGFTSLLSTILDTNSQARANTRLRYDPSAFSDGGIIPSPAELAEAHHFHIYATRHNTHITVTRPDRSPLISVSSGNIGFRHSARKHYDSAFQLAVYVLGRMNDSGMSGEIKRVEVILRGFGAGREAVTKALLGSEGRFLRNKVTKVADATRLKFGGTRSKKPRRLG